MFTLTCEGYKMFIGRMTVDFKSGKGPIDIVSTFLYKPEDDMWYAGGCKSFPYGTSFGEDDVVSMVDYDAE